MSEQLEHWQGEFGDAYTQRNQANPEQRSGAWKEMLGDLELSRVLEVGCNRAHNLASIRKHLGAKAELFGLEPNAAARNEARKWDADLAIVPGNAFHLPFKDGFFDLVFTAGVLIHIHADDLPKAIAEMARVSSRYLLTAEYWAEEETVIEYRGHDNLLWKRDFKRAFEQNVPGLVCLGNGFLDADQGFDRCHWWLWKMKRD